MGLSLLKVAIFFYNADIFLNFAASAVYIALWFPLVCYLFGNVLI